MVSKLKNLFKVFDFAEKSFKNSFDSFLDELCVVVLFDVIYSLKTSRHSQSELNLSFVCITLVIFFNKLVFFLKFSIHTILTKSCDAHVAPLDCGTIHMNNTSNTKTTFG